MRFEGELQGGYGQVSYVKNAQTLTGACWSRKASLGSGNPGHAWIEAIVNQESGKLLGKKN